MIPLADVERALASVGLIPGLPVEEVHERLRRGLTLSDAGQRVLAFYLHEMQETGLYQKTGQANAVQYAEKRLEMDPRRARELIAVGRRLRGLPQVDHALCKREISWSKVLLLVGVATPEHEEEWLARAQSCTVRELALDVRSVSPGAPPPKGERKGLPEVRFKVETSVSALAHEKWEEAKRKLAAECGRMLPDAEVLEMLAEMVLQTQADGSIPGRTPVDASLFRIVLQCGERIGELSVDTEDGLVPVAGAAALRCDAEYEQVCAEEGVSHRHDRIDPPTPAWLRRKILARDGHRCRCCGTRRGLMVHHIDLRSEGGPTQAWNLTAVCERCHALIHEGLIVVVGERAPDIRFGDATGRPLDESDLRAGCLAGLPLPTPPAASPAPAPAQATAPRALSSLENLPPAVDGEWWKENAHLIRFAAGGLQFEEGAPLPEVPPRKAAAADPDPVRFDPDAMRRVFQDFLGQEVLVDRLEITAKGSALQGRPFPHTLLTGPAGMGKSTLAQGIAAAMGRTPVKAVGPLLQDVHQLVRHLACLKAGDVFFVEEVHATPTPVVEALYEAMSEGRITLTLQAGAKARAVTLNLPPFTLLAATTEEGTLPAPFLSRFGLREYLKPYSRESLTRLAQREAASLPLVLEQEAAGRLADFSRGVPRELLRLLARVNDAAVAEGVDRVREADAVRYLIRLGFDDQGLTPLEQRYVALLQDSPGPLSVARLSHLLGANARTLLRDVEPHLTRAGLIDVTPRGRVPARRSRPLRRLKRRTSAGEPGRRTSAADIGRRTSAGEPGRRTSSASS